MIPSVDNRPTARFTVAIAISAAESCERAAATAPAGSTYRDDMIEAALSWRRIAFRNSGH